MAIFKILKQRNVGQTATAEPIACVLAVFPIKGEVIVGMEFTVYETHHPFKLKIRSVKRENACVFLECESEWPLYEGQFVGAVLDSSGVKRGEHYFFDHDDKYGPAVTHSAIK